MKKEMYKISIVMPAYNIAKELARSIDSVLSQSYSNIELIIVDDGSTDNTPKIIDSYAGRDPRVVALHKKNGGVFSARMDGISIATGDYIGFVDGDDIVDQKMYDLLLANAVSNDADISHCGYQMIFPKGRVDYYYGTGKKTIQSTEQGIRDLMSGEFVEPGLWNKLYRRKLFDQIAEIKLDYRIKINEDLLLNYYLFKKSKRSVYEDQCLYHYMIRTNSAATSRINKNKLCDPIKVLKTILEDIELNDPCYSIVLSRLVRKYIAALAVDYKVNPELLKPVQQELRREFKNILPGFLRSKCSIKLKGMALWAACFSRSYQVVHSSYEKFTGLDKKYSTDQ